MRLYMTFPVAAAFLAVNTACSKKKSSTNADAGLAQIPETVTAEVLAPVAGKQILIDVPGACAEGTDASVCESWLGLHGDVIGLAHITNRLVFSIEEVRPDGSFYLAAYPDCNAEARAAAQAAVAAAAAPEAEGDPADLKPMTIREWNVDVDGALPPLGEENPEVAPPPDYATDAEEGQNIVVGGAPPFPECRKLVTPPANLGEPVKLLDPAAAAETGLWKVHFPAAGHPIFVSAIPAGEPRIRLLLGQDNILTAVQAKDEDLALLGIWKKLRGRISKSFTSIENSVADVKKTIGTNVTVDKIGGKKLYVAGALPAAKLYSAVKEQGAQALADANGIAKDGAVYFQDGATLAVYVRDGTTYIEEGAKAGLNGAIYIAEYVMANACQLSRMAELIQMFGPIAGTYEAILATGAKNFAEDLRDAFSVENMVKDKNSPTYLQVMLAVKAYALYASLQSRRLKLEEWESLLFDIIFSLLGGEVKQGFTPKIMSRVAKAMCLGTDEALSSAHALVSTMSTDGIPDSCLEDIRSAAVKRYESGDDICYAMRAEITSAIRLAKQLNNSAQAFGGSSTIDGCPTHKDDAGYLNLLEGVGCALGDNIASGNANVGDVAIDLSTVLTPNNQWARAADWYQTLTCPAGQVAIGMCAAGGNPDCYGKPKELLCASRSSGAVVDNKVVADIYRNFPNVTFCQNNYAITSYCSSSGNPNCSGYYQAMRCSKVASDLRIDYGNCDLKVSKTWDGRLQGTKVNHVLIGACSSGKKPDCDSEKTITKSAVFCPLVPASQLEGIGAIFSFYNGKDHMLVRNLAENPTGYAYDSHGFSVYTQQAEDRVPLHRCTVTSKGDHFASTDPNCQGQTTDYLLGYLHKTTGTPVYRCNNNSKQDHWITTLRADCEAAGYEVESILGYSP